jgi:hypothetical protein
MGVAGTLVSKNLVGRCGLYCGFCLIYRAGKDSEKLRKSVARRSKCKPEDIRCEGVVRRCWLTVGIMRGGGRTVR